MDSEIVTAALKHAKQLGATSAEADISRVEGFSVQVRLGQIDRVIHNKDQGLDLTVYFGQCSGSASTTDLSSSSIELIAAKACSIASFTEADPCAGLAEREMLAFNYPQLELYKPWQITVGEAVELAKQAEAAGLESDNRVVNSEGVSIDVHNYYHCYANSHGFTGAYPTTRFRLDCELLAGQKGETQRDYEYSIARSQERLLDPVEMAKRAAAKAVRRLGAKTLTTRQAPVVFEAGMARRLLGAFIGAISGANLYRQASFLLDHLGQQIFPEFINIDERPHLAMELGSAPFDAEGVITQDKSLVKNGVLESYLLDSYAARKLNMQTTGNAGGVHNLFINSGSHDLNGLIKLMGKGLLVTELIGQGVSLITGDYSLGVFGFWVENGEIQYPVHEITIAGNLKSMFLGVVAIGNDIDYRGNIKTGSILLDHMTIAGA